MTPMSNKSPEIRNFLEKIFPGTRAAIENGLCPHCKNPIGQFRNDISKREYQISGLCQECQDETFGED